MDVILQSVVNGQRLDRAACVEIESVEGVWSQLNSIQYLDSLPSKNLPVVHHGYFDSHLHAAWGAFQESSASLKDVKNLEAIKKVFSEYKKWKQGALNFVFSWNDACLSKECVLDFINSENVLFPVVVVRSCGHAALLNKYAKLYFKKSAYSSIGVIEDKNIGEIYSEIKKVTYVNSESLILKSIELMKSKGVVGYCDMSIDAHQFKIYTELFQNNKLDLSVGTCTQVEFLQDIKPERLKNKDLVLDQRHVKLFLDGSIGSKTAWLQNPYLGTESDFGHQKYQDQELKEHLLFAISKGFSFACHAIGDAALEQIIRVSETICDELRCFYESSKIPYRIEHLQVASKSQILRIKKLGFFHLSLQPCHYIEDESAAMMNLTKKTFLDVHRLGSFNNQGLDISLSSDFPIVSLKPVDNIRAATQLLSEGERISFYDSVWFMTCAAKQSLGMGFKDVKVGDLVCVSKPF